MKRKDFNKITNKEITKKAGLGDITIYRNFNSKEDIIRYYLSNIFDKWKSDWKDDENIGFQIFTFFQNIRILLIYFIKQIYNLC